MKNVDLEIIGKEMEVIRGKLNLLMEQMNENESISNGILHTSRLLDEVILRYTDIKRSVIACNGKVE